MEIFSKSYLPPKSCNFATIKQYFPLPKVTSPPKIFYSCTYSKYKTTVFKENSIFQN